VGDALRLVGGEPLTDHAAKREPAKRKPLDAERAGDGQRIPGEPLDGVVARGHIGGAMTTKVVPQDAEVRLEIRCLGIPLRVIAA